MLLNQATEKGEEIIDERLDVKDAMSILIKKKLFVIKEGRPASAFMYSYFTDKALLTKTVLGSLPHNDHLEEFSICKFAKGKNIILTGGADAN